MDSNTEHSKCQKTTPWQVGGEERWWVSGRRGMGTCFSSHSNGTAEDGRKQNPQEINDTQSLYLINRQPIENLEIAHIFLI